MTKILKGCYRTLIMIHGLIVVFLVGLFSIGALVIFSLFVLMVAEKSGSRSLKQMFHRSIWISYFIIGLSIALMVIQITGDRKDFLPMIYCFLMVIATITGMINSFRFVLSPDERSPEVSKFLHGSLYFLVISSCLYIVLGTVWGNAF